MQTFVVRVFRSESEGSAEDRFLRGVVDDIGAGSQTSFSDGAQLLRILGQAAPPSAVPAESPRPSQNLRQDRSRGHPLARRIP